MSLYSEKGIPFIRLFDYRYIREVRRLRNLTLNEFSTYMKTDVATLSKLENNLMDFSLHYHSKFKEALEALNVSSYELEVIQRLLELKNNNQGEMKC